MIPLLQAALAVRVGRQVADGRRVSLVARPRGVVHVSTSPLTPSGRFVPAAGRTVCQAHTRRLSVIGRTPHGLVPDIGRRRVCARCLAWLTRRTDVPGLDGRQMTDDEELDGFELLTPAMLGEISDTAVTVDETHYLSRLARVLYGMETMAPRARRTPAETAVVELHERIRTRRRRLAAEAMTAEERETVARARDQQTLEGQLAQTARRRGDARDRAADRRRQGSYLTPHERTLLPTA